MSMNHGVADSMAALKRTTRCPVLVNPGPNPLSSGPFPIEVSRQKTLRVRTTRDGNLFRKGRKIEVFPRDPARDG